MAKRGNSIIKGIEIQEVTKLLNRAYADEVEHEEDLQALYEDITEFLESIKGNIK